MRKWTICCLPLFLLAGEARASVLYTNSAVAGNQLQACCNAAGQITSGEELALAFTISGTGTYSSIGFDVVGIQIGPGTTTFAIYGSGANKPGTQLASVVVNPPTSADGEFGGTFSGLTLTAGKTYYLVDETTAPELEELGSTTTSSGDIYTEFGGSWRVEDIPFAPPAFEITGKSNAAPTPEPASAVLTGIGGLLYLLRRRSSARL